MNIQSVKKSKDERTNEEFNVLIVTQVGGQISTVPKDTDNTDYQNILEWVAEGNTIEEAD